MATRLHVTFGESGGVTVKEVLKKLGREEQVISSADDLGFGPLEPFSVDARVAFEQQAFGVEASAERTAAYNAFWASAFRPGIEPIIWLSRRCVHELAGFMEFSSRCAEPPVVIDVADIAFMRNGKRQEGEGSSLGWLRGERLVEYSALDRAAPLSTTAFEAYRARWSTLRHENAPMRVFDDAGVLVSAPLTLFDELILSCATSEWRKAAHVIGDVIVKRSKGPYVQCGEFLLIQRMYRLIADGALDGEGDFSTLRDMRVRRPRAQ